MITIGIKCFIDGSRPLTVISLYNSCSNNISEQEWSKFFQTLTPPFIIGGDFNVHHMAFGSGWTDSKGRAFLNALDGNNIVYLNDGSATKVKTPSQINNSAIDITLVSADLALRMNWSVYQDPIGSDHLPVTFELSITSVYRALGRSKKWNVKRADWEEFHNDIVRRNLDSKRTGFEDYSDFEDFLLQACENSIPKYNNKSFKS